MVIPILQIISFVIAFLLQQYQPPAPKVEGLVYEHPIYRPFPSEKLQLTHPVYKIPGDDCRLMKLNGEQP